MERCVITGGKQDLRFAQYPVQAVGTRMIRPRQLHMQKCRSPLMDPTEEYSEDVLDIWNNLPGTAKGVAIAGIVMYIFTFLLAVGIPSLPWFVIILLLVWPLVVVAWLLIIGVGFAVFSVAALLTSDKITKEQQRKILVNRIIKTVIFIPTVIGTALTLVDAFASDIFSRE
jgi:hypothetical protein